MRWLNGYTWEARKAQKEKWHRWFAWRPVTVEITPDGRKIRVWLDHVERKGKFMGYWGSKDPTDWNWEYREIKGDS